MLLRTFGCQMNEYDSEVIRAILGQEGYTFCDSPQDADIVILNTCAVRETAHRKVIGHIHALHHLRKDKPVVLGILGCMATNMHEELLSNTALKINFIAGPDSYRRLPELLTQALNTGTPIADIEFDERENYSGINPDRVSRVNAWVAVTRGCDNFCAFCVVPYTRGRERSRALADIIAETETLAADGYKQVTLLGQNVNSYRDNGTGFAGLLQAVSRVRKIERVRFMSPHPKDFPDDLIDVVAREPKVCKHVHLPLQAGNSRVLKLMNRTYTQEDFLALVRKIRGRIPDISLSTDIIVGFPTETAAEFEDTVRVMETVEFDSAFIFKYSPRQGTIAQKRYPDDVPEEEKTERIVRLNAIQKEISLQRNRRHIGKILPVLIEGRASRTPSCDWQARTDGNTIVIIPAQPGLVPGDIIPARITGATPHALKGDMAPP
ncbi:MAG TPA: tRNA (N6-isopentenyl adenosine(37)-C2)-methylthiotransferase MiaB [Candidatus Omnitrophota bacterium]|nr:tRNA (N6-isopentenyl adenosine(37)-C2)-methylthiotransferase MiaB [Candidatus Omnitrophota bacterium]HQO58938.1 tRNA (N6-isopentenyl adenosine(37)-C2)-methylthiotransferase MiaB [Candidatus Omnitrophota bacterium]